MTVRGICCRARRCATLAFMKLIHAAESHELKEQKPSRPPIAITPEEFAEGLGRHPESVRRAIRQGRLKAKKFGRVWLIPVSELAAYAGQ